MNILVPIVLLLIFMLFLLISRSERRERRPLKKEKRAFPRYKTSLRIKYKTPLEDGISWIKDISENGARLFLNRTLKKLKIGEFLEIEIDLPSENQSVSVIGNIVWCKEDDAGFQFDKIVQGDIAKITQYINERSVL